MEQAREPGRPDRERDRGLLAEQRRREVELPVRARLWKGEGEGEGIGGKAGGRGEGADGVKVTAAEGLQTIYFLLKIHSTKQFFFFQKFLVYSAHVRDFAV